MKPHISSLFILNQLCTQLETDNLDMMMVQWHFSPLVTLKFFNIVGGALVSWVFMISQQKNTMQHFCISWQTLRRWMISSSMYFLSCRKLVKWLHSVYFFWYILFSFAPCRKFDTVHWTGRKKPNEKEILERRLFGSRVVNNECPDFFSWFKNIVMCYLSYLL